MPARKELRRKLRNQRRSISPKQQQDAAFRLFLRLSRHPWIKSAKKIAVYLASDGEISPKRLCLWATKVQKELYLPCVDTNTKAMKFMQFQSYTPMRLNAYGINEPIGSPGNAQLAKQMDAILLPLVGFDSTGNRLGMGGGYYDRALANKRRTTLDSKVKVNFSGVRAKTPKLIGLAHSHQQVMKLHEAPWDVRLQLIATDKGIITPKANNNKIFTADSDH